MAEADCIASPVGQKASRTGLSAVSLIITCYNQARFLSEAIESALAQTLRAAEIVVVDDGSTDNTSAVTARYPGVLMVRQKNKGLPAARNAGLRAARHPYVAFLDADDRLLPEALETGVACIEEHPDCGFVSGHFRLISADGSPLPTPPRACVVRDHYLELLQGNDIGMHAAVLYRRDLLEQAGGFDCAFHACEDYDLYLRMARRWPVHCHAKVVAEYRWHDANMSLRRPLMLRSALRALHAQRTYVRGNRDREAAYGSGVRVWQRYYGDPLLTETLISLRKPIRWGSAALGLASLLRHYPRGLWRRVVNKITAAKGRRGTPAFLP